MANNIDVKSLSKSQIRDLVKQISTLGPPDDTELAHITKGEMDLLKSLGGSGDINETTGIRSFSIIGDLIYGKSRGKKTYKQMLDSTEGAGTYSKLSGLGLSSPKTFQDIQDLYNRKGKFAGLGDISTYNILNFLKFKEGKYGKTYKSAGAWRDALGQSGNVVAGSLNPLKSLTENMESIRNQIFKDKDIASNKARQELKTLGQPNVGAPSIGLPSGQDLWAKGAIAQKGIENVASTEVDRAKEAKELDVLSTFTDLYG